MESKYQVSNEFAIILQKYASSLALDARHIDIGKYASRFLGINLISYIMMNCSDFRLALLKLADYHHLAMNFVDITLKEEEKFAYYSWNVKSPEINVNYHLVDAIFTSLAYLFRQLTENKVRFAKVRFQHFAPQQFEGHQRIFQCPIYFGCEQNEFVFDKHDLTLPIFMANQNLLAQMESIAQKILDDLDAQETWAGRVSDAIYTDLLDGKIPTLGTIASKFGLSARQLDGCNAGELSANSLDVVDIMLEKSLLPHLAAKQIVGYLLGNHKT